MHKVAIVALSDMVLLDITIPYEAFLRATDSQGQTCYSVNLCGPTRLANCSGVPLGISKSLTALRMADTIVLPGMSDEEAALPKAVSQEILKAHRRGARIVSICSGSLLLAQTGLLDGKRATTHWRAADALKSKHPAVEVDANVLYVESGRIFTSAGAFAGMDLCLHIIRKDFGSATAARSARLAVTALERSGGQAQFIEHELPGSDDSLGQTLTWMKSNLRQELAIGSLAKRARMSVRTFNRQFQRQLGVTPKSWITRARVIAAKELLETTDLDIERIADRVGFPSALSMRDHFKLTVHSSPSQYRRTFRQNVSGISN